MNEKIKLTENNPKKFNHLINLEKLPKNICISTITITCAVNTKFYLKNIAKYVDLCNKNGIIKIVYGNEVHRGLQSIVNVKKRKKRKVVKKKKFFFNQATVVVKPRNKQDVNVKLFANGALQLTGCKNIDHFKDTVKILFKFLQKRKAIVDPCNNKIILKPFMEKSNEVCIEKLHSFDVRMINSNFHIGFNIDRSRLFGYLINNQIECTYEPMVHACVNIKYYLKNKKISIFVFESGSIIITGAKLYEHILKAHKFISKILYENYNQFLSIDQLIKNELLKYI